MNIDSSRFPSLIAILSFISPLFLQAESMPKLIEVCKIWDKAQHNAFTDLVRFKGQWFCAFREDKRYVYPDGAIRVIASKDGEDWRSTALLTSNDSDLRDAKSVKVYLADGSLRDIPTGNIQKRTILKIFGMPPSYAFSLSTQEVTDISAWLIDQRTTINKK
jgi:hypothetical protein